MRTEMKMNKLNRRGFLKSAAAGAVALSLPLDAGAKAAAAK
ncbi:MAG: twin-arginine translocation signal domain-containing protein, partial [Planctomycetes bacterium]|nr:twin-arginine translocation signal domain-containing protein [Planctomycetota bacterium]